MMKSLFSSFDPLSSTLSLNMLIMFLFLTFPFLYNTMKPTRTSFSFNKLQNLLTEEMSANISNSNSKNKMTILLSLFFLVLFLNLMGMVPYVYSLTALISSTLSLAIPMWLGFLMFNIMKNTNNFFSHLVPTNTPMMLSQFMSLIETVSQLIRPITLSLRLAANMTAGHILMSLMANSIYMLNINSSVMIILILLEIAVAMIQAYVFSILMSMYLSETF